MSSPGWCTIAVAALLVSVGATVPSAEARSAVTAALASEDGYWMVGNDGRVYAFGAAQSHGDFSSISGVYPLVIGTLVEEIVDIEPTPTGRGYWLLLSTGEVRARGDADLLGGANPGALRAGERVTALSATATGLGYWLFTNLGGVIPVGDAVSYGDMSRVTLNGPVVASIATTSGRGYYMVGSDGGIFTFGDAVFYGSTGATRLNQPVVGISPTPTGSGYWLVASDGGIFAFGDARFLGSTGNLHLNQPVVGMVRSGTGYMMVASDGGIFNFGSSRFHGSLGSSPPRFPIRSVAPTPDTRMTLPPYFAAWAARETIALDEFEPLVAGPALPGAQDLVDLLAAFLQQLAAGADELSLNDRFCTFSGPFTSRHCTISLQAAFLARELHDAGVRANDLPGTGRALAP
jgi:ribosomal protein L24E